MFKNYYELLNAKIDDDCDIIIEKYHQKLIELSQTSVTNLEPYQDAYYHLSDPKRRIAYDKTIGILHKRHISKVSKFFGYIGRITLTLIDALMELVFSLFLALGLSGIAYYAYVVYYLKKEFIITDTIYKLSVILIFIFICCIISFILQPKIRRYNRRIKNYLRKYE